MKVPQSDVKRREIIGNKERLEEKSFWGGKGEKDLGTKMNEHDDYIDVERATFCILHILPKNFSPNVWDSFLLALIRKRLQLGPF